MVRAKEIVVSAPSAEGALAAVGMIRQAKVVLDGSALFMNTEPAIFPDPDPTMAKLTLEGFLKHNTLATEGFPLACEMAAKASKSRDGRWNPPVKEELEGRLRDTGINLDNLYLWHQRGRVSRIEKKRRPAAVQKAPWFRSRFEVRDIETHVVDAIAKLDWLRDKVAAHRLRDAHLLTPYDVANAQGIARRLLLEMMRSLPSTARLRRKRSALEALNGVGPA